MTKSQTEAEELPRTIVRRVVKDKLSQSSDGEDVILHKDALLAFSESARIFIHYLSATANDICKESKRQIINADDVLKALEEIEFPELIDPLRVALNEFRKKNAAKKSGAKANEADKKRKLEKDSVAPNEEQEGNEDDANGICGDDDES
ncbi:hypothetical protein AAC387_Pa12g0622 [Persea americana]|eukprot:TRINITY_DN534_c0_g1_i1.p1 TRINITY_DN534_c0_g1~~TRINITY_DN534_c0_g1_i1.p1  ORF type:complete len:149 (+),score=41.59 TRINITY_DN534_c0_g1_i1:254-700(+)